MGRWITALGMGAALAIFGWSAPANAYNDYSGCESCHGGYTAGGYESAANGQSWGDSLHNVHRDDMLNGDCDVCHTSGGRTPVLLASSNGGDGLQAISCTGCHVGAGLRLHHVTESASTCTSTGCHTAETPPAESVLPPYYANPGTGHPNMPTDPCNPNGEEDYAATSAGLDNDGDGLYDGDDPDCQGAGACGDGTLDAGEVCDDGNTMDGDGCSSNCQSDETCGNGVVDTAAGEECDDGNTTDGDGCDASCASEGAATCGDGTLDAGEVCDDGNTMDGDGCAADCLSDETCGNGVIDTAAGETCDDGNTTDGDGCDASCLSEGGVCGDGVVDVGEECDDGNTVGGDGCSAICLDEATTDDGDDGCGCASSGSGGTGAGGLLLLGLLLGLLVRRRRR